MSTENACISVVIPVRNGAGTLGDAISSALASRQVRQVVVVDDGSTDGSGDVARAIGDDRVEVIAGPGSGISNALNAGFAHAREAYVIRCDSDDLLVPDKIAGRAAWLEENPSYVAVSGGFAAMDEAGRHLADLAAETDPADVTETLRRGQAVTHLGSWIIRRTALLEIGGARRWFTTAEDLDLQFRLADLGRVWHIPEICYRYRLRKGSIIHTQSNRERLFFEHSAKAFAEQRRDGRRDDLDAGRPPVLSGEDAIYDAVQMTEVEQASHLLEAAAWRHFRRGDVRPALSALLRAIRMTPRRTSLWKGLAAMAWRARSANRKRSTFDGKR